MAVKLKATNGFGPTEVKPETIFLADFPRKIMREYAGMFMYNMFFLSVLELSNYVKL